MSVLATCRVCNDPLVIEVDNEGRGAPQHVPDDLELSCGDHFHWQCLLDHASEVSLSLKCPACQGSIATNPAGPSVTNPFLHTPSGVTIPTRYTNEGGTQEDFDMLPSITEEAYLDAHPEARPARAYHLMCSEGDVDGVVEVLKGAEQGGEDDDEGPVLDMAELVRYQDPLNHNKSALHLAIEQDKVEIVLVLLWIASSLPTEKFPDVAIATAQSLGLQRAGGDGQHDIRTLLDAEGRTAEQVAKDMGGTWTELLHAGVLHPGAT